MALKHFLYTYNVMKTMSFTQQQLKFTIPQNNFNIF